MPNIVYNKLTMHSGDRPLDSFMSDRNFGCIDFSLIYPCRLSERPSLWGTSWGAFNMTRIAENVIFFETGWIAPIKVYSKLAKTNNAHLTILYAIENIGDCAGRIYASPSSTTDERLDNCLEGDEMYLELLPHLRDEYRLIDGRYQEIE